MLRPDQRALTLLLGALVAAAPLAMDVYLPSMPAMARALDATPQEVQLTLSVYMFAWGIAQLFAGPLADRFGRRPVLIGGLVLFTLASTACALAPSVGFLIAGRAVQALATATVAIVPRAVVRDLHAGDRAAHMLSVMMMVLSIAPVIAPIIGSHVHVAFGWRANFWLVALYGLIAGFCVVRGLPETLKAPDFDALMPRRIAGNWGRLLRSRRYVGYLIVSACTAAGLFAFLAGSSFVFIDVLHTGERGFGFLFGTVMLGNITGATLATRLVMRLGLDRLIAIGTAAMLLAGLTMAAVAWLGVAHPAAIVVPMFAYMAAFMWTLPQATAGALTPFPAIAGSATSLLSFCQFVVAASSALAVGMTFDGSPRPMTTAIAVAAVGAFVAFRALVRRTPLGPAR